MMFFDQPRAKKRTVERPFYRKKRKNPIEEITFKPDEREEYLTGFRKRRLQRVKHAQEVAAKKARETRNELRRKAREERKQQYEEHVHSVNKLLRESQSAGHHEDQVIDGDEWNAGDNDQAPAPGQFEDQEQEYLDDDRFTTVTIESVAVSKEGLYKPMEEDEEEKEKERQYRENEPQQSKPLAKKPPPAKPKKKFRYESKHERQKTLQKQRDRKKR